MKSNIVAAVMCALLCSGLAQGQLVDIGASGNGVDGPGQGSDLVGALGANWDVPPYDCSSSLAAESTFVVTKTAGACLNRQYFTTFGLDQTLPGSYGLTYQVACDTGSGDLTSSFSICSTSTGRPCICVGNVFLNCLPEAPAGEPDTCSGFCQDVTGGGCGSSMANRCDGDPGRFCQVDADCRFCVNQPSVTGCFTGAECDFAGCGALPGACSDLPSLACLPQSIGGSFFCEGGCAPAGCGSIIPGQCDDNPNRSCLSAADCGSCSNAPQQPCQVSGDCNFGTCDEVLDNIDDGYDDPIFAPLITINTVVGFPDSLPMIDRFKTGLMVLGLLSIGVVLILRYGR